MDDTSVKIPEIVVSIKFSKKFKEACTPVRACPSGRDIVDPKISMIKSLPGTIISYIYFPSGAPCKLRDLPTAVFNIRDGFKDLKAITIYIEELTSGGDINFKIHLKRAKAKSKIFACTYQKEISVLD